LKQGNFRAFFDPFFRGSNAVKRQIRGTGLGLSLVKEIAPGTSLSYGRTFVSKKTMRIATLTAGHVLAAELIGGPVYRDLDFPLKYIRKEIDTSYGNLDGFFIDRYGIFTLLEVKRSKDPRTRRDVIAQIFDYGNGISRMSFNEICRRICEASELYPPEEFTSSRVSLGDLIHPDDLPVLASHLERILKQPGAAFEGVTTGTSTGYSYSSSYCSCSRTGNSSCTISKDRGTDGFYPNTSDIGISSIAVRMVPAAARKYIYPFFFWFSKRISGRLQVLH
jgi:hypothetical protein